jgi:hypothetical protein
MQKESSGQRPLEAANSTGGQGSRRPVVPSDDDDDEHCFITLLTCLRNHDLPG